jgi:vitamin B12 transporter
MNLAGLFNLETMGLDNVERIEVLRGPAASLYGGKTLGGVINIITRSGKWLAEAGDTRSSSRRQLRHLPRRPSPHVAPRHPRLVRRAEPRTDIQGQRINSQLQQTTPPARSAAKLADTLRFDLDWRLLQGRGRRIRANVTGFGANDPMTIIAHASSGASRHASWETTDRWTQTLTYQFGNFRQVATGNTPFGGEQPHHLAQSFLGISERVQSHGQMDDHRRRVAAGSRLHSRYNDDAPGIFNPGGRVMTSTRHETNWAVFLQSQAEILPGWNVVTGLRHDSYSDFADATTWRAARAGACQDIRPCCMRITAPPSPRPRHQDREGAALRLAPVL